MSVTITHDPDADPNGCGTCPLFIEGDRRDGFDRDGYCAAIAAGHGGRKRLASTVRDEDGRLRFAPDPDCPLRNGGVNVRGPETVPAVATLEALRAKRGGVADERERYITELEAGAAEVRSALGATADETTLDAARRVVAEKERWRDVEHDAISDVLDATLGTYAADHGAVEAVKRLAKLYTDEQAGGEATAALLGLEADEVHRIAERIETLRLYLARAIRGCDSKERRAIEADMRTEGVTPPGVLVSAEEAAVVRTVLVLAAKVSRGDGDAGHSLQRAVLRWRAAGRPLASEGGE